MNKEVESIQKYLKRKGIEATEDEIIEAAIGIARRLGAGDWTFVCEFQEETGQKG
jgi:hypothetical protein